MVLISSKLIIGNPVSNPFVRNGKPLVSKTEATGNLKNDVCKAVDLIGGFGKIISHGDKVLIKPNYNSSDKPPASTDPAFLKAVVELLFDYGAGKVVVGESSWQMLKTRKALDQTGTLDIVRETGADLAFFDEGSYIWVNVGGEYLKGVNISEKALNFDKLIYCCCMKTHFRADFSLSLKLAFGFTKKTDRIAFHLRHLKEKLVDLNLIVHPNLIVMDGRRCFISGGPFNGEVREPDLILASGDRVAMDVESIKVIAGFEGSKLADDPWSYTQIKRAVALELGVKSEDDYLVLTK